jgi:lipoprotein-anchoring transpeptidase ErfK/SrfK
LFIGRIALTGRASSPGRHTRAKSFTTVLEGTARQLPRAAFCGLLAEAPGRIQIHPTHGARTMRLRSSTLRLIACSFAGGVLAAAAAAQAQTYDERFYGGSPSYRTTYSPGYSAGPIAKTTVPFDASYAPGTIVINTSERRLYYVLGGGQALRYGIGVGRIGFTWAGVTRVSAKKEWPGWTPPSDMLRRRPDLPRHMRGGIENPLGARAMYLGSTLYRIHGSNEPATIGQAVSSGCFRMTNEDVIDLYGRVSVGAKVVVLR